MNTKEEGFYRLGNYIYYGSYPKDQVSGRMKLSAVKPQFLKTGKTFTDQDTAYSLMDNHCLTEQELSALSQCLELLIQAAGSKRAEGTVDFVQLERKLSHPLPEEIKILYSAIHGMDLLSNAFTEGKEHFLQAEDLYIDSSFLVFYKNKGGLCALSLETGQLARCIKKKWEIDEGGKNFFTWVLDRIALHAISQMPLIRKGKVKGALKKALNPERLLSEIFADRIKVLWQYSNYGNVILYHENHKLAWFRQNGSNGDILLGTMDEAGGREIVSVESGIDWV